MPVTKIAAAQAASVAGDIHANVEIHLAFAKAAAAEGVSALIFPELSLTGYELGLMQDCVLSAEDPRLQPLRELCLRYCMSMVVGAPVVALSGAKPAIGAICLGADGGSSVYRKRFLHAGEDAFASPGSADTHALPVKSKKVSLAVCADTVHAEHPRWAKEAGAALYAAGVLWSSQGYAVDAALMQGYAAEHDFAVLVANHAVATGGLATAGQSAFWRPGGRLMAKAPEQGSYLVIAEARDADWSAACIAVHV